jgi:polyisoprenoid-binding protein YceI
MYFRAGQPIWDIMKTMMNRSPIAAFVLCLLAAGPARADLLLEQSAGRYVIEPGRSTLGFSVSQVGGGGIKGVFKAFSGSFLIDGRDISRSQVTISVDPGSVDTGASRVDAFIRGKAVFDAGRKPPVTFRTTKVTRTGDDTARIDGLLNARGIDKPANFDIRLLERNGSRITFSVTGTIRRAPYDMQIGYPIYSNKVKFEMVFTGRRK